MLGPRLFSSGTPGPGHALGHLRLLAALSSQHHPWRCPILCVLHVQ